MSAPTPYYQDDLVTLYHGDCREVLPTIAAGSVAALVTDPPYGMNYQSHRRVATQKFAKIADDGAVVTDWFADAWATVRDGGAGYVATRWDVFPQWQDELRGYAPTRNVIVWAKDNHGSGDLTGDYAPQHEFILYLPKGRHVLRGRRLSNVWTVPRDAATTYEHPTQKPVSLMGRAIAKSSDPGDLILDPFAGSGSTLRAAKDLGRRAIGVELEERYCEVIVRRLAQQALDLDGGAA